jgi:hypothetical protein
MSSKSSHAADSTDASSAVSFSDTLPTLKVDKKRIIFIALRYEMGVVNLPHDADSGVVLLWLRSSSHTPPLKVSLLITRK